MKISLKSKCLLLAPMLMFCLGNSAFALDNDPYGIGQDMCDIASAATVTNSYQDTSERMAKKFADITWLSSSCSIPAWNDDYFTLKISHRYNWIAKPGSYTTNYTSYVDANIQCLFTSSYTWECLYQSNDMYRILKLYIGNRLLINVRDTFTNSEQMLYLTDIKAYLEENM